MPKLSHLGQKPAQGKPYARRRDEQQPPAAGSLADRKPYPPRPRKPGQSDQPNRHAKVDGGAQGTKPERASQQLDLSGQQLTQPPHLADYAALSKLNLSNCGLTDITFVKDAASSLTWLNVTGNDLSRDGAWNGVESLSTLFVLNASHCKLTETPRCVGSLKTLKALVLSHNSLTKLEHVASLPDLNTIVVSNNSLTALPRSLATLPALKKISAAHNQLTSPGLPDLSALSHLHELRLNDNRSLSSLPSHFGSWGKAPAPPSAGPTPDSGYQQKNKPRSRGGLEILDLGNCGFESWFGLRELAKQDGIVNLGLKGNKVAEEAVEANGFESFREKLTILLPSLRILDTHRFDAKHAELKAARSSRTAEQKILDAGPMALALNEQSAAPVKVDELLKERERERENRRRAKKGIKEQVGEGKKRQRELEERELEGATSGVDKGKKRARGGDDDDDANEESATAAAAEPAGEDKPKKPKKRTKAERKALAKARSSADEPSVSTTADASPSSSATAASASRKGGALDALRGGEDTPRAAAAPAPEEEKEEEPLRPEEVKQKTSVAKIIDVRKSDAAGGKKKGKKSKAAAAAAEEAAKVDVGALLGLAPSTVGGESATGDAPAASTTEVPSSTSEKASDPFAALNAKGSGLFGSGGWD